MVGESWLSFKTPRQFRNWLAVHHDEEGGAWLLFYKDGRPSITLQDAQEEAACFGWVDSQLKGIDKARYRLKFTRRRKGSRWSPGTRKTAERLIASGRMTTWGLAVIEEARSSGAWDAAVREAAPPDTAGFLRILAGTGEPARLYVALTDSLKRHYAGYYFSAKQQVTRDRRLKKIIESMKRKARIPGY